MAIPTTKHGYPILERKPAQGPGEIVLALSDLGPHPYVVWRMDGDGECHGGDYRESLGEGMTAFRVRL